MNTVRHLIDFKCGKCQYTTTAMFCENSLYTRPTVKQVRCVVPSCTGVATRLINEPRYERHCAIQIDQRKRCDKLEAEAKASK